VGRSTATSASAARGPGGTSGKSGASIRARPTRRPRCSQRRVISHAHAGRRRCSAPQRARPAARAWHACPRPRRSSRTRSSEDSPARRTSSSRSTRAPSARMWSGCVDRGDRSARGLVLVGPEVSVGVEGGLRRGVPQPRLYNLSSAEGRGTDLFRGCDWPVGCCSWRSSWRVAGRDSRGPASFFLHKNRGQSLWSMVRRRHHRLRTPLGVHRDCAGQRHPPESLSRSALPSRLSPKCCSPHLINAGTTSDKASLISRRVRQLVLRNIAPAL
jgi:hypothetical protein